MEYYTRKRSRVIDAKSFDATSSVDDFVYSNVQYNFAGREITSDTANPWMQLREAIADESIDIANDVVLDAGGPFESVKFRYEADNRIYDAFYKGYRYVGPQFARAAGANADLAYDQQNFWLYEPGLSDFWSNDDQLDALGATAISRCSPTNPHASALNALIELYRDGLPSAIGLNAIRRRDLGGEYLNYEFGILPTISDIKTIGNAYRNADKLLKQYYRDSGRVVRRRYSFPSETRVVVDKVEAGIPATPALVDPLYVSSSGVRRTVVTQTRDVWFSGAFTYYAKAPSSVSAIRDQVEKYDYLYGISPNTSVLWNALPYSWAADWVTNIGDVMNNVKMFSEDGLVMHYGYVMEHVVQRVEIVHTGTVLHRAGPVEAKQVFTFDRKRRRKATPFGFGLELDGFTDRQWAILAALGMSRGRGALR